MIDRDVSDPSGYDPLAGLEASLLASIRIFEWREHRPTRESGKPALVHVKCAVSDSRQLFVASANLTEYALSGNMELGLLITGGHAPARVEEHFDELVAAGALAAVSGLTENY